MARRVSTTGVMRSRRRPKYRAARAFYLTLLLGVCLAIYVSIIPTTAPSFHAEQRLWKRDEVRVFDDEQCHLVHQAEDQCAFVKRECPSDEAGFSAYLDLYFCRLNHVKGVAFMILVLWLGVLFSTIGIAASDFFCINLSTIATILGMSESMAGVTFLAFGNGSPDVFSTFAAMNTNSGSLAVGELFGAAGFITAVVAGSMALIRPFRVAKKSFIRDVSFFTVAAGFSIVFLWDGKLRFWECAAMVVYYVVYVLFVMAWHWLENRRRRERERHAIMREHFIAPQDDEHTEIEPYQDDPDERDSPPRVSRQGTAVSREDWSALERAHERQPEDQENDEAEGERWLSELNSNMRLTRPNRSRSQTLVPVRPSLVGALEFQVVLKSLQKSRNIQTIPLRPRAYSDDPTWILDQQNNVRTFTDAQISRSPEAITVVEDAHLQSAASRGPARAVSANAVDSLLLRTDREATIAAALPPESDSHSDEVLDHTSQTLLAPAPVENTLLLPKAHHIKYPDSPDIILSPSGPQHQPSPLISQTAQVQSNNRLAPPQSTSAAATPGSELNIPIKSPRISVNETSSNTNRTAKLPRIIIPGREGYYPPRSPRLSPGHHRHRSSPSGTTSPTLCLPSPILEAAEFISQADDATNDSSSHIGHLTKYWPYKILPPPGVLISTLFPTIYHWRKKSVWGKALGVVAAPSVFLLTITLPVAECSKDDDCEGLLVGEIPDPAMPASSTNDDILSGYFMSAPPQVGQSSRQDLTAQHEGEQATNVRAMPALSEIAYRDSEDILDPGARNMSEQTKGWSVAPIAPEESTDQLSPAPWNRWLLLIQLFLAPQTIVFAIYLQSPSDLSGKWLLRAVLISLLVSVVLLVPLLLTTTPTKRLPLHRYILSLAGFVVSIAWISTIAAQVVGALKALAVILNMSHAIMGLTIFAVGQSLGDLVADVTVARLGYPVMALSACFGGPMLNILLGIGLSGSYMLYSGAQKRVHDHPDKHFKFKVYQIEVSNTLLISGFTLLITLVGLLIIVPLNRWMFSKRIGWGLIVIWVLSTICNVALEISGWAEGAKDSSAFSSTVFG